LVRKILGLTSEVLCNTGEYRSGGGSKVMLPEVSETQVRRNFAHRICRSILQDVNGHRQVPHPPLSDELKREYALLSLSLSLSIQTLKVMIQFILVRRCGPHHPHLFCCLDSRQSSKPIIDLQTHQTEKRNRLPSSAFKYSASLLK
jgi:hypothetical protein